MSDPAASAKSKARFRHAYAGFADMGMIMSLAAAAASGVCSLASGSIPHWAAIAGGAISAVYLTLPRLRNLARGLPAEELPPAVLAAANTCAVRATQEGYDGIWAVHEPQRSVTRFMTEKEFADFRSALPDGTAVAVVETDGSATHVRRYVVDALHSSEDDPAHRIFDAEGYLTRSIDYARGRYTGERELEVPPRSPSGSCIG